MAIRITKLQKVTEATLKSANNPALDEWLQLSIEDLEFRLRYSTPGETQVLQGALRALYDIQSFT